METKYEVKEYRYYFYHTVTDMMIDQGTLAAKLLMELGQNTWRIKKQGKLTPWETKFFTSHDIATKKHYVLIEIDRNAS